MDALTRLFQTMHAHRHAVRFRDMARAKVLASPLVQGCANWVAGPAYARALLGGFWSFVDAFPAMVRDTRLQLPAATIEALRGSLASDTGDIMARAALHDMESDESMHRDLWVRSAGRVGLTEAALHTWPALPEVRTITDALQTEPHLARRLLYFVAVEVVAAEASRHLLQAPRFVEAMGEDGSCWFTAHLTAADGATTHESVAYVLAVALLDAAGEAHDEMSVDEPVARCINWFFDASVACARAVAEPPPP